MNAGSKPQNRYLVKVALCSLPYTCVHAHAHTNAKAQTEVTLLLIPEGSESIFHSQSALGIRTLSSCTGLGRDGKEQLQENFKWLLEKIEDVRTRGVRYSAENNTFLGQAPIAPLDPQSNDRPIEVDFCIPAYICTALFGLHGRRLLRELLFQAARAARAVPSRPS